VTPVTSAEWWSNGVLGNGKNVAEVWGWSFSRQPYGVRRQSAASTPLSHTRGRTVCQTYQACTFVPSPDIALGDRNGAVPRAQSHGEELTADLRVDSQWPARRSKARTDPSEEFIGQQDGYGADFIQKHARGAVAHSIPHFELYISHWKGFPMPRPRLWALASNTKHVPARWLRDRR
jgi:hypothetical protein